MAMDAILKCFKRFKSYMSSLTLSDIITSTILYFKGATLFIIGDKRKKFRQVGRSVRASGDVTPCAPQSAGGADDRGTLAR